MRLLIDFGSIKTGGGAQLATNFLTNMKTYPADVEKVYLLLPEQGPLSLNIDASHYDGTLTYPDKYWRRKHFELTTLRNYFQQKKIDFVFTFFGAGIPSTKNVRSITSVAYPIICYPDSPYWKLLPLKMRLRAKVINELRRRRIRLADKVIAETEVMAERLVKYAGIEPNRIAISPPSPSAFIEDKPFRHRDIKENPKLLFLSGLDRHKNIWRLPEIAHELEKLGRLDFTFMISATRESFEAAFPECKNFEEILSRHFEFVGSIPSQKIQDVYDRANFLVNISDLESFSNNYMEAWKSGLPLICSDTDFSRSICADSAIYINPHNAKSAAKVIAATLEDIDLHKRLTDEGKILLSKLPDLTTKFSQIMKIIRESA